MMTKKILHTATVGLMVLLFFSQCNNGKRIGVIGSTGKTNELILVIPDHMMLISPITDTIKAFFTQNDFYLPQPEPLYNVITVNKRDLNMQSGIKKHHNLLIININDTIEKSNVVSKDDLWAVPQMVIQCNASSDSAFFRLFRSYQETILERFDKNEFVRARNLTDFGKNIGLAEVILKQFSLSMSIPAGFYVAKQTDDFLWFYQKTTRKNEDMTASIMIWKQPYISELQFSVDSLISTRNKMGKQYIPGPTAGSYMQTATDYLFPKTETISDDCMGYTVEMRGLWRVEGDFMGGPFISYTFVHPTTNQLITIDAFLYHPNNAKRALLRQLQAIITNIHLPAK
jgi:hypothetical protein